MAPYRVTSRTPGGGRSDPVTHSSHLTAQFRITPDPKANCAIVNTPDRIDDVEQNVVCPDGSCDMGCECMATIADNGHSTLVSSDVNDHCVCPVFGEHDCVVSFDGIEDGQFVVSVTATDREQFTTIVSDLREVDASVQLQKISRSDRPVGNRLLEIDASAITDKQREAVKLAVESGYYDSPRRADLNDLADELGVSRSAVSQRLRAVESKLISELADT